jgi:hypothetical protein
MTATAACHAFRGVLTIEWGAFADSNAEQGWEWPHLQRAQYRLLNPMTIHHKMSTKILLLLTEGR